MLNVVDRHAPKATWCEKRTKTKDQDQVREEDQGPRPRTRTKTKASTRRVVGTAVAPPKTGGATREQLQADKEVVIESFGPLIVD